MEAIFMKDNVYVAIIDKDLRDEINIDDVDSIVYETIRKSNVSLYGGRVHLFYDSYHYCVRLEVDGIRIKIVAFNSDGFDFSSELSLFKVAAFLNQMENLGIDSFLENYKKQLQEFKKDLEKQAEIIEQEQSVQFDEKKSASLASLKRFINRITCIIFSLLINMNAGLENHVYTDTYNEIINLYF